MSEVSRDHKGVGSVYVVVYHGLDKIMTVSKHGNPCWMHGAGRDKGSVKRTPPALPVETYITDDGWAFFVNGCNQYWKAKDHCFPGGKIEVAKRETVLEAAQREFLEETSVGIVEENVTSIKKFTVDGQVFFMVYIQDSADESIFDRVRSSLLQHRQLRSQWKETRVAPDPRPPITSDELLGVQWVPRTQIDTIFALPGLDWYRIGAHACPPSR
jgi:8-oxo-dGTP pyrophosphatase MutT (NUDIX family)